MVIKDFALFTSFLLLHFTPFDGLAITLIKGSLGKSGSYM